MLNNAKTYDDADFDYAAWIVNNTCVHSGRIERVWALQLPDASLLAAGPRMLSS